jgi:hypothetical protein
MARQTIVVSDLSGEQVTEDNSATVRVLFGGEDIVHVGDFTRDEVDKLFRNKKGDYVMREQQKRGRKAGSGNGEDSDEDSDS